MATARGVAAPGRMWPVVRPSTSGRVRFPPPPPFLALVLFVSWGNAYGSVKRNFTLDSPIDILSEKQLANRRPERQAPLRPNAGVVKRKHSGL